MATTPLIFPVPDGYQKPALWRVFVFLGFPLLRVLFAMVPESAHNAKPIKLDRLNPYIPTWLHAPSGGKKEVKCFLHQILFRHAFLCG